MRKQITTLLLGVGLSLASGAALADDTLENANGGGLGGAAGAAIGNEIGGQTGAIVGGGLGGAGGAVVADQLGDDDDYDRHDDHYRDHDHGHRGHGCPPGLAKQGRC